MVKKKRKSSKKKMSMYVEYEIVPLRNPKCVSDALQSSPLMTENSCMFSINSSLCIRFNCSCSAFVNMCNQISPPP